MPSTSDEVTLERPPTNLLGWTVLALRTTAPPGTSRSCRAIPVHPTLLLCETGRRHALSEQVIKPLAIDDHIPARVYLSWLTLARNQGQATDAMSNALSPPPPRCVFSNPIDQLTKHRLPLLKISAVALSEFNEQAKSQKRPVESGRVVEGLGALMRNWRTDAPILFEFRSSLKNLHKTCLVTFKKEMLEGLRGESYNFADAVYKAQGRCVDTFSAAAQEALVEGTDWAWEGELGSLKEEVRAVADWCRKDETKKMLNLIEKNFKKAITEPIELALNKANTDMWDRILRTFKETLEKAEATYSAKAISFNCTEEENVTSMMFQTPELGPAHRTHTSDLFTAYNSSKLSVYYSTILDPN
ncbi:root hair defective 3 GTP-binding protein-domain-containing protein [Lyophyllum atratum]|nr:root hair defective 3 GTP-binding protein-domain-containing protein [Lyophyllum atratum]